LCFHASICTSTHAARGCRCRATTVRARLWRAAAAVTVVADVSVRLGRMLKNSAASAAVFRSR
jgi:hypothetical protein